MRRNRIALLVGVGAVVAIVVVVVAVFVLNRQPTAVQGTAPNADSSGSGSVCGLEGTPAPSTEGATKVTWDMQTGWPLPISVTDGPAKRDPAGPWSCYAHTPSGAVLAAYVISMRASGVAERWQDVTKKQTVPTDLQQAHISAGLSNSTPVTPRGFDIAGYSSDRATVRYYLHTSGGDASCTIDVEWEAGDWKVRLQSDGGTSSGCVQQIPDKFTPWGP